MSRARIAAEKLIKLANDVDDELPHLTVMQAFKDVIEEAEERIFEATKAACMRLADKVDLRSGIAGAERNDFERGFVEGFKVGSDDGAMSAYEMIDALTLADIEPKGAIWNGTDNGIRCVTDGCRYASVNGTMLCAAHAKVRP